MRKKNNLWRQYCTVTQTMPRWANARGCPDVNTTTYTNKMNVCH
jgi:hypothetical protein